jgi:multidrug efflux pump subunit AcrA (membrane-fusion protein)
VPFYPRAKLIADGGRGRALRHFLLACLTLAALASLACKSDYPASAREAAAGGEAGEPKQVRTVPVAEIPLGRSVTVTGTLAAFDQATLSAKVPGRVRSITVDLGSGVRRGQVVAQLEAQDYQLRVEQAEAALAQARARLGLLPDGTDDRVDAEVTGTVRQARATLNEAQANRDRAARLVAEGVIARAEYESADATLKVALARYQDAVEEVRNRQALLAQRRSELALARQQLADTNVYAPFDGMVHEKRASVGEYLAAGAPLVTVVKMNPLRLRAEVPEREAQSVHGGERVSVHVEGGAHDYEGRIRRLSPTISEQNRVLVVEAEISNDGTLRPGAFVSAEIETDESGTAVTVPTSAIVTFAGIEKVITVENGKAREKPVTTGRRNADWTEILGGVQLGDRVVVEPGNLQSGQAVNAIE